MKKIWLMFFGPYEEEWRSNDGLVDNREEVIAKRLGLEREHVRSYIRYKLNVHFDKLHRGY